MLYSARDVSFYKAGPASSSSSKSRNGSVLSSMRCMFSNVAAIILKLSTPVNNWLQQFF